MKKFFNATYLFLFVVSVFSSVYARDQMQIVGSATVYPFTALVAENLSKKNPKIKAPVVEATGTGGGIKFFCDGVGMAYPDAVNASREIKQSELDLCKKNGVLHVEEFILGLDAITIIKSNSLNIKSLSIEDIFFMTAKEIPDSKGDLIKNPYTTWQDINPSFPDTPLKIIGPPVTSGTFESFLTLSFSKACKNMINSGKIRLSNPNDEKRVCSSIRTDGAWINGGENYSLTVSKVKGSNTTLAIIGYSYYIQASDISAVAIGGIYPDLDTFQNRKYPLVRPLFIYIKRDHMGAIPGMPEFLEEARSSVAIGPQGYLVNIGLIPVNK